MKIFSQIAFFALTAVGLALCAGGSSATSLEQVDFDWGASAATPVSADYDGDGIADPALYIESAGVWNAWPWTQLGYTYAWLKTGNNVMGFSEFVVPGPLIYTSWGTTAQVFVVTSTGVLDYATSPDNSAVASPGAGFNIAPPE